MSFLYFDISKKEIFFLGLACERGSYSAYLLN